jgi:cardiolipin synthase
MAWQEGLKTLKPPAGRNQRGPRPPQLVVDDTFASVGSGNFDNRSIRLNDEANLDVLDRQFAAEQVRFFEMDKRKSHQVTLEEPRALHFANPFDQAAGLLSPQL